MRKILLNAAMLLGALLLFVPLSKAQLQDPTAITIDPATVELKKGETKEITLKFVPETNVDKEATVVAEPADKLTVSVANGVLKLVADKDITAETAVKVTVTSTKVSTIKAVCNVTLKPAPALQNPTAITIDPATVELKKGETKEITLKFVPETNVDKEATVVAEPADKLTVSVANGVLKLVADKDITAETAVKVTVTSTKVSTIKAVCNVTLKPAALFTLKNEGKATVKVEKKGTDGQYTTVTEADYSKLAANDEIKVTVEAPAGKEIEKVTVKVGTGAEEALTATEKKYIRELKLEAGKPVVVTVTMKTPAKVTLTVTNDKSIKADAYTTTPALATGKVEVDKDAKVTFTFKAAPEKGKMYQIKAKEADAANVTVGAYDATKKTIEVTVKGNAEVTVALVPAAPAASIVDLAGNAKEDAEVKAFTKADDGKFTKETKLEDLKANEEFVLQITAKEGKKITKVEVKVGDAEAKPLELKDNKYTTEPIKVEAGKKVVVTVTTEEPPAAALLEVKADQGVTVKVEVAGKEVTDFSKIKAGDDLTITVTAPANKPVVTVTVTEEGGQPKTLELKDGKYTHKMGTKKTVLTVTAKTPAEDAVLAAVAVYPNPFVGQLFVANTAEVAKVALVNAQGVVVRTVLPAGANELNIAVEDLPAGVYVLVLEREGARKAIRLVK